MVFHKDTLLKRDMTLQAPTQKDCNEWIRALRLHQIDIFRSRSTIFESWLKRQGVAFSIDRSLVSAAQFVEDIAQDTEVLETEINEKDF